MRGEAFTHSVIELATREELAHSYPPPSPQFLLLSPGFGQFLDSDNKRIPPWRAGFTSLKSTGASVRPEAVL